MRYWRTLVCALALGICGLAVWADETLKTPAPANKEHGTVVPETKPAAPVAKSQPAPADDAAPAKEFVIGLPPMPEPAPPAAVKNADPINPSLAQSPDLAIALPTPKNESEKKSEPPKPSNLEPPPAPPIPTPKLEAPPALPSPPPLPPAAIDIPPAPPKLDPPALPKAETTRPPDVTLPPPPPPVSPKLDLPPPVVPAIPSFRPPAPPADPTPASFTKPAAPYKLYLRMGAGQSRFDIKEGDLVVLKVSFEKIELHGAQEGSAMLPGLTASGHVKLHGAGLDGTCDSLTIVSSKGEVQLKGNVRMTCYRGATSSQIMAEQMSFQLGHTADGTKVNVTGPGSVVPASLKQ
ncbi:MAG: hypothetical protein ACJ8F7_19625 [Gemmataceae bacterium]